MVGLDATAMDWMWLKWIGYHDCECNGLDVQNVGRTHNDCFPIY